MASHLRSLELIELLALNERIGEIRSLAPVSRHAARYNGHVVRDSFYGVNEKLRCLSSRI